MFINQSEYIVLSKYIILYLAEIYNSFSVNYSTTG